MFGKDVFLMRTALAGEFASPGALVSFRLQMGTKGPQATGLSLLPPGCVGQEDERGQVFSGTVKSFNAEKGWGFVTSDEVQQLFGKDIMLHRLQCSGATPSTDDLVDFTVEVGRQGRLEAMNVVFAEAQDQEADVYAD